MKIGGWIFMLLSWGAILSVVIYCYSKIIFEADEPPQDDYRILK